MANAKVQKKSSMIAVRMDDDLREKLRHNADNYGFRETDIIRELINAFNEYCNRGKLVKFPFTLKTAGEKYMDTDKTQPGAPFDPEKFEPYMQKAFEAFMHDQQKVADDKGEFYARETHPNYDPKAPKGKKQPDRKTGA